MATVLPTFLRVLFTEPRPGTCAVPCLGCIGEPVGKACKTRERLEARSSRIRARDRTVHERIVRFFGLVSIPHVLRDATDEVFRLIGRIVRHGEHAARLHIDAHERCRGSCSALHELAQRRIGDILH